MIAQLGLIVIIIATFIYLQHMAKIYTYWKRKGVIGPIPYPVVGNYVSVIFGKESEGDYLRKIYEQYPNEKVVGVYKGIRPVLVVRDLDYIKCVLNRDFDHFSDRCIEKPLRVFNKGLFSMRGNEKWKTMRQTLSPYFTKAKLANMIPQTKRAVNKYLDFVKYLVDNKIDNDIRDIGSKYTIECIGNLILDVDLNAFGETNEFQTAVNALLDSILKASSIHTVAYTCPFILDVLSPLIRLEFDKRVFNVFRKFVTSLIYKPRDNETVSNTFISTLINLKEKSNIKNMLTPKIDDEDITQQIMTFCLAIYESTSTTLALMIHKLALHQEIQEKCYKEIMTVYKKNNGELSSEYLSELQYLEMTLDETVRIHPPSHCIERKCVSKYTFPNTKLTIDKGIYIVMPIHGSHHDPKYFPNPEVFDPERFSLENKAKIQQYAYMPFGIGPRMCFGPRLAKLVLLTCMSCFLEKYKVSPSSKTKTNITYDPARLLATTPLDSIWVNIEPRN